jgi:hypothetical protein
MEHSVWREDGSIDYNCCWFRQCSHSQVRVPRESWPHFTVWLNAASTCRPRSPYLYPQEQGGPVIPTGTGFLFVASYDSQGCGGGIRPRLHTGSTDLSKSKSKSKSKLCYDRRFFRPVSLGVKHPSEAYDQIFITVRQLQACWYGALSLTRGRVYHLPGLTVISLLSVCTICILQVIKCMYIQHIQGICQFRLSTADYALLLVAPATTTVYSLERSYDWPPPSLSLLYFLCRVSPYPMLRAFSFLWFCMTSACCLHNFVM